MKIKELLVGFVVTFVVVLVVAAIVTYLWNLIVHGQSVVDWEMSFRLAIALGVALPISWALRSREKQNGKEATSRNAQVLEMPHENAPERSW
jgi:hypothetical protein